VTVRLSDDAGTIRVETAAERGEDGREVHEKPRNWRQYSPVTVLTA
jgi:hypothetical protein